MFGIGIGAILLGVTFMAVNVWNIIVTTKLLQKLEPITDKSLRIFNKLLDKTEEEIDE